MRSNTAQHWDIFCRIVDNFGDIGICWRLSQQLVAEHDLHIRLFIDNLETAKKIIPSLNPQVPTQIINNVEISIYPNQNYKIKPAKVALETFSCGLPEEYINTLTDETTWINLEYLSAEPWVEDFHLVSSNNTKIKRHFYFPGFTVKTGGLIRENEIIETNQNIAGNPSRISNFFNKLKLSHHETSTNALNISLFGYPQAPIEQILNCMAEASVTINCYVPYSSIVPDVAKFFNVDETQLSELEMGICLKKNNLNVYILPFLKQEDYDMLLACCDLNFVRGEDSWIRAIWANKPFIWQPYLQSENTHLTKLKAFLDLFYSNADSQTRQLIDDIHHAWSTGSFTTTIWEQYLDQLPAIKQLTSSKTRQLAELPDLASKLVIFLQKN